MISIELEYRPVSFIPWIRRIEKKLPSRWSELNAEQISSIPDLQLGKLDDRKQLQIYLRIGKNIAKRVDSFQAYCITRNLKYVSEPEPLGNFIIPRIAGLMAPLPKLKDVTFGAFIFGDSYFSTYKKGKQEDLDKFIACFYCGKKGFDQSLIETHAKKISKESLTTRTAIAINYILIREWLSITYEYVFQKEAGKNEKSKGWVGVFDRLVQNDLANQDKYSALPVSTVFRHLNNILTDRYKYGSQV